MPTNSNPTQHTKTVMDRPLKNPVASLLNPATNKKYDFPFNINSLNWNYQINTQSYDTYGGRVTQVLSAMATTMMIQGEAGSRKRLLDLYTNFKSLQDYQNQHKTSMQFNVPSRNLTYRVWLEQMSIAWDVSTVTYPYAMSFQIQQDISYSKAPVQAAVMSALDRANAGIGFNTKWNGLNKSNINLRYQDVKNFSDMLKNYGINT